MDFKPTGSQKHDLWLVDASPDFAIFPANIIPSISIDTPIWLKVGSKQFGETHIREKHGHWVSKQGKTVPELVYFKLGQSGPIYCTESHSKLKISLSITPAALLVLDYNDTHAVPHFSVTTLYNHPHALDGQSIGRYKGRRNPF
jgi:hypothetical protein